MDQEFSKRGPSQGSGTKQNKATTIRRAAETSEAAAGRKTSETDLAPFADTAVSLSRADWTT